MSESSGGLADFFDLIALPKGQIPGEVTQTSRGDFVNVVAISLPLHYKVRAMIRSSRASGTLRAEDADKAILALEKAKAELAILAGEVPSTE